jgi:hypothetical protein
MGVPNYFCFVIASVFGLVLLVVVPELLCQEILVVLVVHQVVHAIRWQSWNPINLLHRAPLLL